ncbi:MAG: hypothetical protein NW205_00250 [Hyphomicrobiaceae bacterium]|nr:hypothetical protein [Hyphomicrobiaceae bacterium]
MSMRTLVIAIAAACLVVGIAPDGSGAALAHSKKEGHAHDKDSAHVGGPKHGGQFQDVDGHHGVEMLVSEAALVFHMSEHGEPLEMTGSVFKAVVQSEAGTKVYALEAKGTTLSAKLDAPLAKGAKVVISGKDPHQETIQARFVVE